MKNRSIIFIIVLIMSSLAQVVSDIYLPSLPALSQAMQVSAHLVQLSLFSFTMGLSVSLLFYGAISDAFSRKPPAIFGLSLCIVGSIICVTAHNITIFNIGRAIQGIGAGAGLASRVIIRDMFSGTALAKLGSYLSIANIGIMTGAPFLGGYLQHWFGWHASFIFLIIYTVSALVLLLSLLPETNQHKHRDHLRWTVIKANLTQLRQSKLFISRVFIIFLTYAGVLAWLTAGPIVLHQKYGVTPVGFGWLCLLIGIVYAIGALSNARLLNQYSMDQLLTLGAILTTIGGILVFILSFLPSSNIYTVFVPLLVFMLGASIIFPNAYASALIPFGKIAGIATSMIAFLQILGGATASALVSMLPDHNVTPMGTLLLFSGILSLWIIIKLR